MSMAEVVLVYPYFDPPWNNSVFRHPPLGLGYLASYLRENNVSVDLVDCTFLNERDALERVRGLRPSVIGVYSMFTMREESMRMARRLREECDLMVVGGPLPSVEPEPFLEAFDVVAVGEGEQTMLEIARNGDGGDLRDVNGIRYRESGGRLVRASDQGGAEVVCTQPREFIPNLDSIPYPARDLFENEAYMGYYRRRRWKPSTSIMSSRGCPFSCDFCSRPVFGGTFRERSPGNVAGEVEEALSLGYDRVFFQDDCFTLNKGRVHSFCDEVEKRGLEFDWECLSRVDTIDEDAATRMREAGCRRIFFGLESGSEEILKIMNKRTTPEQGRRAVEAATSAGIKTGAFFIIGYPGETDETMLETLRFASSLPLDYLSFSFPYPIPGTGLYERVKGRLNEGRPEPRQRGLIHHELIYASDFSERKLRFAVTKAMAQFYVRRYMGAASAPLFKPLERITDGLLRAMK